MANHDPNADKANVYIRLPKPVYAAFRKLCEKNIRRGPQELEYLIRRAAEEAGIPIEE